MSIRKAILSMAGLAMVMLCTYEVSAQGCIGCDPPGTTLPPCETDADAGIRRLDGTTFTIPSSGVAHFQVVAAQQGPGAFSDHKLLSFTGSGNVPNMGTFTWIGDPSRPATISRVVSNNTSGGFPGTSDIYMHMKVQLSWQPGKTFRSRTEVHVRNTNLTSWSPHVNQKYSLVSTVDFEDAETGEPAFRLISLNTTLN